MNSIVVIAHNIRSTHNVGSFFRTCDGFGVGCLYLTGYTPYPLHSQDNRLPHIKQKITAQIHKTALGAEKTLCFVHSENPYEVINQLRQKDYRIIALEQTETSTELPEFVCDSNIALLIGEEVHGIPKELLSIVDECVEIPMQGHKESFNVSVALGIGLYGIRFNHRPRTVGCIYPIFASPS